MKPCPTCDAVYGDGHVFCPIDGARLSDTAPRNPSGVVPPIEDRPTLRRILAACASCGAVAGEDKDGCCPACGEKYERKTLSLVPIGATIAGRVVVSGRSETDFIAREPDGREVLVVIGSPAALAVEGAAAKTLADAPLFPRLIEIGEDPRRGSFLALTAPPATSELLGDAVRALTLSTIITMLRAALRATKAAEDAQLEWQPDAADFFVEQGVLFAARLRVARRDESAATPRANAAHIMATIGRAMLPIAAHGPVRLVRMLVNHGPDAPARDHTVEAMLAELDAAERELAAPPEVPSLVGATCDPGLRRNHNEDAFATASGEANGEPWAVLVVCDGVSSSTHAEQASTIGAKTTCDALAAFAETGDARSEAAVSAMTSAIRAAHRAICAADRERAPSRASAEGASSEPPGTTIVAALVYRRTVTFGWVGDSRAYWVSTTGEGGAITGAELLTRDHSWVNEAVERGDISEEEALRQPLAHALTHCLGPLENQGAAFDGSDSVDPEVRTHDLAGPGLLVLCSDGLWNYFPNAAQIGELARSAGASASPLRLTRHLVNHALARGGGDNVTVAIYEQK